MNVTDILIAASVVYAMLCIPLARKAVNTIKRKVLNKTIIREMDLKNGFFS
jgi:hypothetical protein